MDYKLFSFVLLSVVLAVSCKSLDNAENATTSLIGVAEGLFRTGRARTNLVYANLISCAIRYDTTCLVDAAGDYFEERKNELLAQADSAFVKSNGRADPETTPSHVAKSIEKLLSELSGLFKDSVLSFFSSRESEEDDEVVDSEGQDSETSRAVNGEERGKKKKKQQTLKSLKFFLICAVISTKLGLLLGLLQTALLLKLALLSVGILGVSVAKLVILVKNGKPKTIYYENSHHDHHYEHDDVWHGDHEHWRRSFSQNLAYSTQKPRQNS